MEHAVTVRKAMMMKIAIAQMNSHLGQCSKNSKKILEMIFKANDHRCSLVIFPECSLLGYHPMDLLDIPDVVERQWKCLEQIHKKIPTGMGVLIGALSFNQKKGGKPFFNSAVFLQKGKKAQIFSKELLPSYDVFDEARYIESGRVEKNILSFKGSKFLVTVCEDIWAWPDEEGKSIYGENPLNRIDKKSVDCILNLSASPFYIGKQGERERVAEKTSRYFKAPLIYANLIGGQDELIFDGSSFVMGADGAKLAQARGFEEDILVFDFPRCHGGSRPEIELDVEKRRQALVLGIRDYVEKSGFSKAHLGLSGGVDSAVVLCLLVDALGASSVTAVGLPSSYNDPRSLQTAKELAETLGVEWLELPIQKTFDIMVEALKDSISLEEFSFVHENLQARIRGNFLMAFSNQRGSLLISTGNKSEYATGYTTLYGDMCGGLAPIGDLLKKQVYELAAHYNGQGSRDDLSSTGLIPKFIIERPPSAELRPDQKDEDELPNYDQLDKAVEKLITKSGRARGEIEKKIQGMVIKNEFKRWQASPILKVSKHSFGLGRRMPLAMR